MKWKYVVEVKKANGLWSQGATWAVHPGEFRAFLSYINGENDPKNGRVVLITNGPPLRVKRISDSAGAQYNWPEDRKDCIC